MNEAPATFCHVVEFFRNLLCSQLRSGKVAEWQQDEAIDLVDQADEFLAGHVSLDLDWVIFVTHIIAKEEGRS